MSTRIRFRRSTAASWTSANPTLTGGELGYETDTGKFKIGDNTTAWTGLAYSVRAQLSEGYLNDLLDVAITSAASGDILKWNGTAWVNDSALLAAKAPLASPTFTGTVSGVTATMVGLGSVDNTADTAKPVSTVQQTALGLKANIASPTFTGTVSGVTASMVGLGSVNNTADTAKPVSTAQQTALDLKAPIASPTFTGTVSGITKTMVGLGSVDNTADTAKPVSTAQQTALDLKANLASPTFTGTPTLPTGTIATTQTAADSTTKVATTAFVTTADNLKANLASPTFTGTLSAAVISTTDTIASDGRGEFRTVAAAGRGIGVGGGSPGDTPAIIQFVNNAFGVQWGNITASSAYALAINAYDGTAGSIALNASSITTSTPITGSITQTIYTPYTSGYTRTNTSATPADITGFNMSITPKKTGNKIIILVQIAAYAICDGYIQLKKNGTQVATLISLPRVDFAYDDPPFYAQYVDTAASTAAITYQFSGSATGCGGVLGVNYQGGISSTIMIEVQS